MAILWLTCFGQLVFLSSDSAFSFMRLQNRLMAAARMRRTFGAIE